MKIARIEDLHCDAGWRTFSFLKITTDDGLIGWSEYTEADGSRGLTGVIRGLDAFEGRSSLSTWIYRILINRARTRAGRDARNVPFSAIEDEARPTVDPAAFGSDGRWRSAPSRLDTDPETSILNGELRRQFHEKAVAEFILAWFQGNGLKAVRQEVEVDEGPAHLAIDHPGVPASDGRDVHL